ncbi:translation elongation factor Ts [Saccharothrix longispora]|uniref:translation elongation factor Ts n=1 Tax=Saccharothrix longispora TaxID=33920 RepID=UPI0028FD1284|nr:translation elongation factor Ts [Saccharothrix longispora]MBY8852243.1 translation elongation factor Ts [Saccharothrix sp. MB29]MDU0291526.1 translation elongation factor Ts [Saccharothrix longispora]
MANYTAADVKRLRELTAAGMMDCKKALEEADGDFDKAVEILRIKGAKDVGKRAERTTSNGLVLAQDGVMVELRCETDFVAKNADFQELASRIVAVAKAARPADVEALKAADLDGKAVDAVVQEFSAKIGEKLELAKVAVFDGAVTTYLHRRAADLPPAVGVVVEYTGDNEEAARGAAMQIAAMRPRFLTRDEVPADVVANERRIAEETAREEGKPEAALPKIVEGRVNGFFKDVVLLEQSSVTESKKTVKAVLDEAGVTVTRFARFEVGQA